MRREKKKKNYLKSGLKKSNSAFLKNQIHEFRSVENQPQPVETDRDSLSQIFKNFKNFNRSKNRMDRSNQAGAHHIFQEKHNF